MYILNHKNARFGHFQVCSFKNFFKYCFLFRLKGVEELEISEMCYNMMNIFGLETYETRLVQKLR
jgi:hypothetical protein